jgi:formate-dependent nitrite reductase membrane component NrfD
VIPALLVLFGLFPTESSLWQWGAPLVAGVFLALTGLILIADLDHPERFSLIFTRRQWKSWLVRGAFIITGYAAVLAIHFLASFAKEAGQPVQMTLMALGLPLSVMTAVYTAYLFAQATARDLWQNSLLPFHFFVQALLVGAVVLLPCAAMFAPEAAPPLAWLLSGGCLLHLLLVWSEITLAHPTAHARLAAEEMTVGAFRQYFRAGVALVAVGVAAPWIGIPAALPALIGLLAHEHAYVQAGQAVPLA